jgi:Tol biopolymer transport system component
MTVEAVAPDVVEAQLARMLDSQTFRSAERSKALLRFVVLEALAGRANRLKDYTLGVEVLGRGDQFDPRTDPIARVEASRLRSRLELYYATEGSTDPLRILLPKGGYVPAFEPRTPPSAAEAATSLPGSRAPTNAALWRGVALAAAAVLVASGLVAWRRWPSTPPSPEMRLEISTPPTTDPLSLAISPEGTRLVFVASDEGLPRLWLRRLQSTGAEPLKGTEHASLPFWSPDGREIGFFADGRIKRLALDTGLVRDIATALVPAGAAWNRDGVILHPVVPDSPLFRTSVGGDAPRPATVLSAGQTGHRAPHFLPDQRRFLFYAAGAPAVRGVYVGDLQSSAARRLADADAPGVFVLPDRVLYVKGGTLFAQRVDPVDLSLRGEPLPLAEGVAAEAGGAVAALAAASAGPIVYRTGGAGGQRQFVWFDRSGRELSRVGTPETSGPAYASMSPDRRRLAVQRATDGNTDIWIVDLERGTSVRFTHDPEPDIAPVWSPAGDRIVYSALRDGVFQLVSKPLGGGPETTVLATPAAKQATDWSADGRWLLFREISVAPAFDANIGLLALDGRTAPAMLLHGAFEERDAQFSPDARWLAYQSNESGRLEVYVQPLGREGARMRISTAGGAQARWRADGRELYYLSLDGQLMAVPLATAEGTLRAGAPQALFRAPVGPVQGVALHHYIPSPDGTRFLIDTLIEQAATPLTILLNWHPPR